MPGFIGFPEILLLLVVVLLLFGPKRLPEMGRSLGKGMREFKDSVTGEHKDDQTTVAGLESLPPAPPAAPVVPVAPPVQAAPVDVTAPQPVVQQQPVAPEHDQHS